MSVGWNLFHYNLSSSYSSHLRSNFLIHRICWWSFKTIVMLKLFFVGLKQRRIIFKEIQLFCTYEFINIYTYEIQQDLYSSNCLLWQRELKLFSSCFFCLLLLTTFDWPKTLLTNWYKCFWSKTCLWKKCTSPWIF